MRLVIASNNEHKIREIKEILGGRNAAETLLRHLGELERERLRIGEISM